MSWAEPDEEEYARWCDEQEYYDAQRRAQPEPTAEDHCASAGHAYYGDEDGAPETWIGRCYCGERRYPAGGPPTPEPLGDEEPF